MKRDGIIGEKSSGKIKFKLKRRRNRLKNKCMQETCDLVFAKLPTYGGLLQHHHATAIDGCGHGAIPWSSINRTIFHGLNQRSYREKE